MNERFVQLSASVALEKESLGHHRTGYVHTHKGTSWARAVDNSKGGVMKFPGEILLKERGGVGESELARGDGHKDAVNIAGFLVTEEEAKELA